jgi:1,4-dihydroxy-6-naphthoate synthase
MLHNKIDTEGLIFDAVIADINELNNIAIVGSTDVVKISFAVYPLIKKRYRMLNSGSALGYGNGPLLVTGSDFTAIDSNSTIAIPGLHTSAAILMRKAFPHVKHYMPMLFSDIPMAIKSAAVNAGVLIHESRFTYEEQGLRLLMDLGQWWEQHYHLPIPLGGIAMSRTLQIEKQRVFARVMRSSVNYAIQNPDASRHFVKHYAKELNDDIINKHINMFVNNYTENLGATGRQAVRKILAHTQTNVLF